MFLKLEAPGKNTSFVMDLTLFWSHSTPVGLDELNKISYVFLKCDIIQCNLDSSLRRTKFKGSSTKCISE